MIIVATGTEKFPMDRLPREIDRLIEVGALRSEDVFVQLGSCNYEPKYCPWKRRLSFGEMHQRTADARLMIAHGGAGTFLLCRSLGTPEIMVPRRAALGEHVDDHQLEFSRRLTQLNYVTSVENIEDLHDAIKAAPQADAPRYSGDRLLATALETQVSRMNLQRRA